jgi:hypothetical protein
MTDQAKSSQLQIRVSPRQKTEIQRMARHAGMDMSAYILARVLPPISERFDTLLRRMVAARTPAFELAELNDLLSDINPEQLTAVTAHPPPVKLSPQLANYVAAMVEYAAGRFGVRPPDWVRRISPLSEPLYGTDLQSLRMHLLSHSPPPFRRRNIFIDSSLGSRV